MHVVDYLGGKWDCNNYRMVQNVRHNNVCEALHLLQNNHVVQVSI